MIKDDRLQVRRAVAQLYGHARQTGAPSAAKRLERYLAPEVRLDLQGESFSGSDLVLRRLVGEQPGATALRLAAVEDPIATEGGQVRLALQFPAMGASPLKLELSFEFDDLDRISRVDEREIRRPRPEETDSEIPLEIRGLINNALANGVPMVFGYVGEDGYPSVSIRASVRVYGPRVLSMWLRVSHGAAARSLALNPHVSLMYRDNPRRETIRVKGVARIVDDKVDREMIYQYIPEVEQNHDPDMRGSAVLIEIQELIANTSIGDLRMRHPRL